MLASSTSAGDKHPNKTEIDTSNEAIEKAEENFNVSSRHSATHGSRKEPSIASSRSSRMQRIHEMKIQNLRAKKETEQRLPEQHVESERERAK